MPMRRRAFTLVELMIVISIAAIIAAVAIPSLLRARMAANESAAIGALRTVSSGQIVFKQIDSEGDSSYDYATSIVELSLVGLVDDSLGGGTKAGYVFVVSSSNPVEWNARARPLVEYSTGARYFYVDESGVIRYNYGTPADATSRPVE